MVGLLLFITAILLGLHLLLEGKTLQTLVVENKQRQLVTVVPAQLINVSSGEHIWSETFDRKYRDIFQI